MIYEKKYILLLAIFFIIIATYLNSRIRDFESITGITSENVNKILIGGKVLYENYDELILKVAYFNDTVVPIEYRRVYF